MSRRLVSRMDGPAGWGFVSGVGASLVYAAAGRTLVSDRAWMVGLLLLGLAVLVLSVCVVWVRSHHEDTATVQEPLSLTARRPRRYRGSRRPRPRPYLTAHPADGSTQVLEGVVCEPVHRPTLDPNATTVVLSRSDIEASR